MANIILQHYTGELKPIHHKSIENIEAYANSIGSEYKFIEGDVFQPGLRPPLQKVYLIDEVFDNYDTVVMVDIDMFAVKGLKENIFDVPGMGLYGDVQRKLHDRIAREHPQIASIFHPYWGGAIYKFDLETRKKLRQGLNGDRSWIQTYQPKYHYGDEGIMHTLAYKAKLPLSNYISGLWCYDNYLPNPEKAKMIHIREKPIKDKFENYKVLVEKGIL